MHVTLMSTEVLAPLKDYKQAADKSMCSGMVVWKLPCKGGFAYVQMGYANKLHLTYMKIKCQVWQMNKSLKLYWI